MLNRFFAFIFLIAILPILIIVGLLVLLRSGRPVLFYQPRVGLNQELFTIVKFRTMKKSKVKGQKKIIPGFGRFLRTWKLDELPTLWNIVKGDMVFVGPRPFIPEHAKMHSGEALRVFSIKPGITSPASVKYINEEKILQTKENAQDYNKNIFMPDKIKMNLDYIDKKCFGYDIKIIFWTLFRKKIDL